MTTPRQFYFQIRSASVIESITATNTSSGRNSFQISRAVKVSMG